MRHRTDHLPCRVARKLGIGVERDHVADVGEHVDVTGDHREAIAPGAAQQCVQLLELAALALPAHPQLLPRVPATRPMQEEKSVALHITARSGIFSIQRIDSGPRVLDERCVGRHRLGTGIAQVGEQREMQAWVLVCKMAHFERLEQRIDVGLGGEECRHDDERPTLRRNRARIIHPGEDVGIGDQRDQPVAQRHRELAARHGDHDPEPDKPGGGHCVQMRVVEHPRAEQRGDQHDDPEIQRQRRMTPDPAQSLGRRQRHVGFRFEPFDAVAVDEKEAHVMLARVALVGDRVVRELHRLARDVGFRESRVLRDPLDHVPIAVARREVHLAIDVDRILAQLAVDRAHRLDELAPVDRAQCAQAADAVADGHLIGGLLLRFGLDHQLDRAAAVSEAVLDPGERERKRRRLSLQLACQLGHERTDHPRTRSRHVGNDQDQIRRIALGDVDHPVGPVTGDTVVERAALDARGHAPQVLDQCQAQHDRDPPQLAELERRHRLIRSDESAQALRVDASVGVRDRFEREVVDARQLRRRTVRKPRQLPAVALRQVPLRDADLFFDQVEVVEQPLAGRCDPTVVLHCRGQQIAGGDQHRFVACEAREQAVA